MEQIYIDTLMMLVDHENGTCFICEKVNRNILSKVGLFNKYQND